MRGREGVEVGSRDVTLLVIVAVVKEVGVLATSSKQMHSMSQFRSMHGILESRHHLSYMHAPRSDGEGVPGERR